ncbi:response regulator transcription factor [Streptomyces sp. NBC_01186]|uniref:response regulator transcription factor n=1 Tax=Streptomyces sp. NBC_01186 TaxID=2903765 RepID=UPI002E115A49|nr:response regulator transcription factor [Streptomyces sp. NBC_01186]
MTTIRVLIADDQKMVRQGFTVLLNAEPGIEVVGEAVDGLDAVDKAAELAPDVALVDIRMPRPGGIDATRRLTERDDAALKVLVLTTFDLDEYGETEVLSLIAQGLSNQEIAEQLVVAEQAVKTHVSRILVKLGLRDRTQAAVFAYETGLVRPAGC